MKTKITLYQGDAQVLWNMANAALRSRDLDCFDRALCAKVLQETEPLLFRDVETQTDVLTGVVRQAVKD